MERLLYNTKKRIIIVAGTLCLVAGIVAVYGLYRNGFIHCVKFHLTQTAADAFNCGNYYFSVYGSYGYDVAKAEEYFGKAVAIDPNTPDAWHQYARTAFLRGSFSEALVRIDRQFKERGDELMAAYYIRGLIYGYAKKYDLAEKDFLRFLEWSPTNWAANNDLAWIYFAQGKFEEARVQTEKGLVYDPNNAWLLMMHAMSMYNLGGVRQAQEELLQAKEAASKLTEADWSRAYPGNDPAVAGKGLASFRQAIEDNLTLVHKL